MHEMGHALHPMITDPMTRFVVYQRLEDEGIVETLEAFLSTGPRSGEAILAYALTSPVEFVAEMFLRLVRGDRVDARLLEVYQTLLGPEVSDGSSPA